MEVVTNAFEYVRGFGWEWVFLPIAIGCVILIVTFFVSTCRMEEGFFGYLMAAIVSLLGGLFVFLASYADGSSFDQNLLRSDMAEQLQIHEVVQDDEWYVGKDSDGQFVKFALIKKDNTENTYSVLMEK